MGSPAAQVPVLMLRFPRGAGIVATAPPGVGACSPQASSSVPALAT